MDFKKLKEIDYQGLAIQHCEKAAIALVGCLLVLFMLSAVKNYRASSSVNPQYIKQLAEGITKSYQNSQFNAESKGIVNPNLRGELAKLLGVEGLDLDEYRWKQLLYKFVDFGGVFRDQPEILKPYSLMAVQSRGPTKLYATNDRGDFLYEDFKSKPKEQPKKPKVEEPPKKKANTPTKTAAKGPASKGMGRMGMGSGAMSGGGGAGGMEMGGMGMAGGGGFGGPAGGAGDEGIMPGMGGGRGGRSGRSGIGMGTGGENLSASLAQNNPSGKRRRTGLGDDSAVGDEPEQKSAPNDPKKRDTTKPDKRHQVVVRGLRWVVVTALFPHVEQLKKYKDALHDDEAPDYLGFKVERRYVQSDGTFSAWAPVDMKEMDRKVLRLLPERWEHEDPDLLAAKALFDPLVVKVPELLAGEWLVAIRRPAVEAARKVLGGGTGNQITTGGAPGADADGMEDTGNAGVEGDPNAGFVGLATSAGTAGAGFPGGQAGRSGGSGGGAVPGRGPMSRVSGSGAAGGVSGAQPRSGAGNKSTVSKSTTKKPIQTTKAETIMLRFVDYTVEPEHTYQYRLKVVVANPNYNHPFVVNDDISKPDRLEGDWSDPSPPVLVEEDTKYYVLEKTKIPTESEKIKPPEAKFEVHKWFADLAEWQLESFTARAGDTIGKMVPNHMMVTFDNTPEKKKTEVDFSTDEMVLDVTGSSKPFNVDGQNFIESSPADVLVVDKLGELVCYNELAGKNNPARKQREDLYKSLLKDAIEPDKGKKGDSTPEPNKADDFDRVPTRREKAKE